MMLRHFDGDFRRNSFSTAVHGPNRLNQFFPQHAFQKIAVGTGFKRSLSLYIAAVRGQNDNPGVGKFLADGKNRFTATHERHLQIHKRDIRTMYAELLDRLASIAGFRDKNHVRLAGENRGDPFAQYRMIVYAQNSNWISPSHDFSLQLKCVTLNP